MNFDMFCNVSIFFSWLPLHAFTILYLQLPLQVLADRLVLRWLDSLWLLDTTYLLHELDWLRQTRIL